MSLDEAFGLAAVALAASAVLAFVLVIVLTRVRPVIPSRADIRSLLRQGGSFASFSALAVVGARMDMFLVGLLSPQGLAVVGIYYAVTRLVGIAVYHPETVSRAIYPRLSREYAIDPAEAAAILRPAARELLALGIAIPFGFALAGSWLIGLVFGPDYTAYAWLLVAFGVAMPFRYQGFILGVALTSAERQAERTRAMAIAVVISLALNLALIPSLGIVGALIGVATGWVVNCLLLGRDVVSIFGQVISIWDVARFLGLALLAFLIGLVVRAVLGGALADPIAGLVFAGVFLLGLFGRPRLERPATA